MRKIVFPINERDYFTMHGRICYWIKSLSNQYLVELWTQSEEVCKHAEKSMTDLQGLKLCLLKSVHRPLTFGFRDNLAKIFVKHTENIKIPGTDLHVWKTAAFDDFWGHITSFSFPEIETLDADIVLIPLLSFDDNPWEETDVFYSSISFLAKDRAITLLGYQLYPVFNGMKLMAKLMDGIIVRKEFERKFHLKSGIPGDRIYLLKNPRDVYSISTIEDSYENHILNSQIEIGKDELGIVVCNHPKMRPQIREIFQAIKQSKVPTVLSLLKREFVVRELKEDQIIENLYYDDIRKIPCRFFLVENKSMVPIMMISDVVLSPSYIIPLEFASRYKKKAWIYNHHYQWDEDVNGVRFFNQVPDLALALEAAYEEKKEATGINDVIESVMNKIEVLT